ncbi:MAG: NADH oxidoreductase (quinone) subunit F [Deltaproteobacteria bacterium RIFCSPLOWO2_02_FULL_46_8]|nr:MAG: NADH oxidoreductase (quinone) subunit F [Deltaproteobacteria bacterium RIFCSPLOWO2_02_FULL_46_8]
MELILSKNWHVPDQRKLSVAEKNGAYSSLKKIFGMTPLQVIEEVKASGLRGRGGAGFATGMKWGFIPKDNKKPVYLINNFDESEPGTFKDRMIAEKDPHMIIEGMIIASYAIGAHTSYIYIRGEYHRPWEILEEALKEAYAKGYLGKNILGSGFDLDIFQHRGAGAYICGEETALLSSLEGGRGYPRIKPPFPAIAGAWACPTIVNNVETLSNIPYIINNGGAAFKKIGTEKSAGTKLMSASGHINKPGVYEVEMGLPIRTFIEEHLGGVWKGRKVKGVVPGGSSFAPLTNDEAMRTNLDFESCAAAGTSLGSGGFYVMDDTTCMVRLLQFTTKFYAHESCGQCTPCREGSGWIFKIARRIESGNGRERDLNLLEDVCSNVVNGRTICVFADAMAMPVQGFLKKFRNEFEEHIRLGKCPHG